MSSRELRIRITAAVDGFQAGIGRAQQSVMDFDKALAQSAARRQAIDDLGSTFGKIGLAAAGGVALATKAAMDWESAWAGVTKTVDGSAAQLATLEGQLRDMATSMPATHQEIAAVAQAAGALGVATPDVADFTRVMIMLGEATDDLSADQAATSMAQLMNVMQTGPEDVDNLANALVRLGNNGASTEGQILQMAQNLAGAGQTIGLAESDVLGIANALASVGIEAEAGGSAVSKILIDMATAAKTGSPELAKWADASNMTAESFKQLMADDPAAAFTAFTEGLGQINAEGGDVFTLLSELGQSDVRVTRALLGMAGAGDLLSQSLADSADAYANGTDAVDEYEKRSQTAAAQVKVAWNGIKDNLIDIGQDALPVVKALSEGIADLTGWFSDLPQPVKDSTLRFLALTAAVGGTGFAISRTVTGFASMTESLANLTGQAGTLSRTQLFARGGSLLAGTALAAIQPAAAEANEALGLLTATAAGAAVGTAILPGWGTAIGATAGAIYGVRDAFGQADEASVAATRRAQENWSALIETLGGVNAAITEATRSTALASLRDSGLADDAKAIGIELRNIVDVSLGIPGALEAMDAAFQQSGGQNAGAYSALRESLTGLSYDFADIQDEARETALATTDFQTALASLPPSVVVDLQNRNWQLSMDEITALQEQYNLTPGEVQTLVDLQAAAAQQGITELMSYLLELDGTTAEPGAVLIDGVGGPSTALLQQLGVLDGTTAAPDAILNDYATPGLSSIWSQLTNLDGKEALVTVRQRIVGGSLSGLAGVVQADGGVVDYFAGGGFSENHVAQIAPAGAWRVWAEPETGGEAYIPLAASKRQRSLDIWAETGKRLGAQGFANGGMVGGASSTYSPSVQVNVNGRPSRSDQQIGQAAAQEAAFQLRSMGGVQ